MDARFPSPPETGLESNLGRMPVVTIGDQSIGQSVAIYNYLASENGLLGDNNLEAAQILSIGEHLREMLNVHKKIVPPGTEPSIENANIWFDTGAEDDNGIADRSKQSTRYLKWWLGRIERALGSNGFAVGSKLSLADIQIYYVFAETLTDAESPEGFPQWKRQPFGNKARMEAILTNYPKISSSINAVAGNVNFQKWLSTRGPQDF